MGDVFEFDVFVSHSSRDKSVARELARRLRADGLTVWFDEWEIQPGDMIGLKIEQGLAASRTVILLMSGAAFGSEWVTLERQTAFFRDPINRQRRFIPVRIDDTPLPVILRQFSYVDWRRRDGAEYQRLLRACNPESALEGLPVLSSKVRLLSRSQFPIQVLGSVVATVLFIFYLGFFHWSTNQPQINVPTFELVSEERFSPRGGMSAANVVHLPRSAEKLVLLLTVDEILSSPAYRFVLRDRRGKLVWQSEKLLPNIQGGNYFSIEFPRSYLEAGSYSVDLYDLSSGKSSAVASYLLEVQEE